MRLWLDAFREGGVSEERRNPRVFISYAHGAAENKAWVTDLYYRLMGGGVRAQFDELYLGGPRDGWNRWMKAAIEAADFVIVLWDDAYRHATEGRVDAPRSGAEEESTIIRHRLKQREMSNSQLVLVAPEGRMATREYWNEDATRYELPRDFEELYRKLTNQPRLRPAELGSIVVLPTHEASERPEAHEAPSSNEPGFDALDRALHDRHPERCGALALRSEALTSRLIERLTDIDPTDLRELVARTTARYRFASPELVAMAEVLFFAVGLRWGRDSATVAPEERSLYHALWSCQAQSSAVRWDETPRYPRTLDVRDEALRVAWWVACWSWSVRIPAPNDADAETWSSLFPGWFATPNDLVRTAGTLRNVFGWQPATRQAGVLLNLGLELWRGWGEPPLEGILEWPFLAAAIAAAAKNDVALSEPQAKALRRCWFYSPLGEELLALIRPNSKWASTAADALLGAYERGVNPAPLRAIAEAGRDRMRSLFAPDDESDEALNDELIELVLAHADPERLRTHVVEDAWRLGSPLLARLPPELARAALHALVDGKHSWLDTALDTEAFADTDFVERLCEVARAWEYTPIQKVWARRPQVAAGVARQLWQRQPEAARYWFTEAPDGPGELLDCVERTPVDAWPTWVDRWLTHLGRSRGPLAWRVHALVVRALGDRPD